MIKAIRYDFKVIKPRNPSVTWVKTYYDDGRIQLSQTILTKGEGIVEGLLESDFAPEWSAWINEDGEWVNNKREKEEGD